MGKLTTVAEVAKIVESAAAIIALAAGAWWFVAQRKTYPHGDITQSVTAVPVKPGILAVEVQVSFENTGDELVELTAANVKLQGVESAPYDIAKLAEAAPGAYWSAMRPIGPQNSKHFTEGELRWPVLNQYVGSLNHKVEPGETDVSIFTFIVRCEDPFEPGKQALRNLRIATDLYKPRDPEEPDFAWKARSFTSVSKACRGGANVGE